MSEKAIKISVVMIAILIQVIIMFNSFTVMNGFLTHLYRITRDIFVISVVSTLLYFNLRIYFGNKSKNFEPFLISILFLAVITIHTLRLFFSGLLC